MYKYIKKIQTLIIVSTLLLGAFLSIAATSSAQDSNLGLFSLRPTLNINIENPEDTTGIIPADPEGKIIKIDVLYQVSGILSEMAVSRFEKAGINAQIQVSVGDTPDYCNVFLYTYDVQVPINNAFETGKTQIQMKVTFLEGAPLMAEVSIPLTLKASAAPAFPYSIQDTEVKKDIPVSAAYIPIIDAVPTQTFKEVSPGEIATFKIELENKGNAETEFRFDLESIPEDWTANIVSQTKIASAALKGNAKKIVTLEVRPPYRFGYHDEEKQLVVNVQGFYYAESGRDTNTSSKIIPIRVIVRNRGFSFQPGVEMAIIFIVIIALIILAIVVRNYIPIKFGKQNKK